MLSSTLPMATFRAEPCLPRRERPVFHVPNTVASDIPSCVQTPADLVWAAGPCRDAARVRPMCRRSPGDVCPTVDKNLGGTATDAQTFIFAPSPHQLRPTKRNDPHICCGPLGQVRKIE